MIRTTRWRRMILHLLQIRLTDARTFMNYNPNRSSFGMAHAAVFTGASVNTSGP